MFLQWSSALCLLTWVYKYNSFQYYNMEETWRNKKLVLCYMMHFNWFLSDLGRQYITITACMYKSGVVDFKCDWKIYHNMLQKKIKNIILIFAYSILFVHILHLDCKKNVLVSVLLNCITLNKKNHLFWWPGCGRTCRPDVGKREFRENDCQLWQQLLWKVDRAAEENHGPEFWKWTV